MTVSPVVYASLLTRLVAEARMREPKRYNKVGSWSELHDVCDANEFCIEANELLGVEDLDEGVDLFNAVVEDVESVLFH